ncbi:MAG: Hsp70 family protein [Longimicrobiales bacterium]|nr:Hsp70 family protein [Longimicrobiales bacterium]
MSRSTIDFGIDLGTTNSTIAVLAGTEVQVFRNNEGFETTPSAVWLDKGGRLFVGRRAKERLVDDGENAVSEFKLQMGTSTEYHFARDGRTLRPEQLSAEVLKSLKADVAQRTGEDVQAAVITVPAAFELPQCKTTEKAAELAGFKVSPLLQEPVAAALVHGFQSESDKVFWLVYDLGGGTFDAAVIQVRDGAIRVVNHGGDNHLGGKLIDWEIVDRLLVSAVAQGNALSDFRRGNPKWRGAFAKLKQAAEEAKIRLSRDPSAEILIDFLCSDDRSQPVRLEMELSRSDVEGLIEPYIVRSLNICKKVLSEKRLGAGDIERVLLVGGPTLTPYLRERLADPAQGLGIKLDHSQDPLTVVARGAAIFAGTQRLEVEVASAAAAAPGACVITLDYKPVGADTEPLVGGKVTPPGSGSVSGYTVEFVNEAARPPWRSGKVGLSPEGTFVTALWAEKGKPNVFRIELCDSAGSPRPCSPSSLTYTVGLAITDPPLIHSMGIALADGTMDVFFAKGTPLPARSRKVRRTTVEVRKGQSGSLIVIPVVEGENKNRVDRNQLIGTLEIQADRLRRDLPAGSEVEVTIEVDASRLVRTLAYVPLLDEEFEGLNKLEMAGADPAALQQDLERERKRLVRLRERVDTTGDPAARESLRRIDQERMEHDVESALAASRDDRDAADKCAKRLLDLKQADDDVEDALEWPLLVSEANETIGLLRKVVAEHGNSATKQQAATLERELREATEARDMDRVRRKISEMDGLRIRILKEQPGFWVALLQWQEERKESMRDRPQAEALIAQAYRAINSNDVPALQAAVQQLMALLPADEQDEMRRGFGSTVL